MKIKEVAESIVNDLLSIKYEVQECAVVIYKNSNVESYEYSKIIYNFAMTDGGRLLNNNRGYFDRTFFVHDKDTVVAWNGIGAVFWHKGWLTFMYISKNAFDIYLCDYTNN